MTAGSSTPPYVLGSTDAEHERLIRQAAWLAPHTERCFREAGIGPGQRVLDLGSGVGAVAMLVARLVGPSGEVVGIERDPRSLARARDRVAEAGLRHVSFVHGDVAQIRLDGLFDATVGRYILMYLPDPVLALRSVWQVIRPGGVVAFQEPEWSDFLQQAARLPLWSAGAALMIETLKRSRTSTEMGRSLPQVFAQAGLPAPSTRTDILLGAEEWMPDVLLSMRPQFQQFHLPFESFGDLDTLSDRLKAEIAAANVETPLPALVSAWSRKPKE